MGTKNRRLKRRARQLRERDGLHPDEAIQKARRELRGETPAFVSRSDRMLGVPRERE